MQGQCRIQKRNWICESGYIPASSSRPKKCKEDLKRYAFTLGGVQQLRRKEKRGCKICQITKRGGWNKLGGWDLVEKTNA